MSVFYRETFLRKNAFRYVIGFILFLSVVMVSCSRKEEKNKVVSSQIKELGDTYKIVVTTGFINDIVSSIVGDYATIYQVMGTGIDPHTYTPTRSDIVAIYNADLVIYSGIHLEGNMYTIFNRIANQKNLYSVESLLGEKIPLLENKDGVEDPHIWMDVRVWRDATFAIGTLLAQLDSARARSHIAEAKRYADKMEILDNNIASLFQSIPQEKRIIVTSHDAFEYFGARYHFEVLGIQGISTVSEASLKHMSQLIDIIVSHGVDSVFVESTVSEKYMLALIEGVLSRGHYISTGGTLYADSLGVKGTREGTYIGMVEHNALTITKALGGDITNFESIIEKEEKE